MVEDVKVPKVVISPIVGLQPPKGGTRKRTQEA